MARSPALGLSCDCQERKQLELPAQLEVQVRWKKKKKSQKAKKPKSVNIRRFLGVLGSSGQFWAFLGTQTPVGYFRQHWATPGSVFHTWCGNCTERGRLVRWCVVWRWPGFGFVFVFVFGFCLWMRVKNLTVCSYNNGERWDEMRWERERERGSACVCVGFARSR